MAETIPDTCKAWIFKKRPKDEYLGESHVEFTKDYKVQKDLPEGSVLFKLQRASYDASTHVRASLEKQGNYFPPLTLGVPLEVIAIAKAVKSNNEKVKVGVSYMLSGAWSEYFVREAKQLSFCSPLPPQVDLTAAMCVNSLTTGLTSYYGLYHCAKDQIKAGNTLVVSGASGGVGQMVVQMAKILEMRVVAITGSEEKCEALKKDYKADAAVNYKDADFEKKLREACPKGVHIYFDNVGGKITDAVFGLLAPTARVALCGAVSDYVQKAGFVFKNFTNVLMTRSRVEGFIVGADDKPLMGKGVQQISQWLQEGKLKYKVHLVEGLENAPKNFERIFTGEKKGKIVLKVE